MAQALERIESFIGAGGPHYVVTPNVDFAAQASRDVELHRILCDADLVLCDGMPLVWASRWLGASAIERVAGADLLGPLLERAAERGHRVFFLGTSQGVLEEAKRRSEIRYPGIRVCGVHSPPYVEVLALDHEALRKRIREARPDILLVAMGPPKQEKFISMNYRELGVPCCIGVGASLDFLAGRFPRAPAWMRRTGAEWLFRLLQEPRRLFSRYWADMLF
jgi:N-acetylglucosaminyldiphosphoundecaprenol N-acetyl-beta-D-mannosaminyltransferase